MQNRPLIAFVSAVYPSQYTLLAQYLRQAGLADAWFFTMPGHAKRHAAENAYLLPFQPDGNIMGAQGYYYSGKVERSARISRGLLKALQQFEQQQGRPIDVVVTHSLWGAPNWLYDELQAAIVSYIEFPSYRAHGWEAKYPPDASQRMADRSMEMLHFHQVLCSDLTITPSAYARSLFPPLLQARIAAQFEGFDIAAPDLAAAPAARTDTRFTLAFAARDLSSAKGLETFMRLVDRLVREGDGAQMRFVALGAADAPTYGYEQQWVQRRYPGGEIKTFLDHLRQLYPAAAAVVEAPGKLPYAQFAATLGQVDLFLYPLRYGVANWGLMEILARGGCVLGSNWGFVPELIEHDVNGLLLPDQDDAWIDAIRQLRADPARRARYAQAAVATGQRFHIAQVAPAYMQLFERAMAQRRGRVGAAGGGGLGPGPGRGPGLDLDLDLQRTSTGQLSA